MRKYGFNMQWMFEHHGQPAKAPDLKELDFIAKRGFNFIRVPLDYKFWTRDFDYLAIDESVTDQIDSYLAACSERGLHMCLNMHRAPGFCTNHNHREKHSLWTDDEAQRGFVHIWSFFAKKFKGVPSDKLSFNLLNEPPAIGKYGLTRDNHEAIMRATIKAIRDIDPQREIVLDGIDCKYVMPELADTGAIQSGRGYEPFTVSHYKAEWLDFEYDWPEPAYPCTLNGVYWDRKALLDFYQPWKDLESQGVRVHIGEFGCYNKTPSDVALAWQKDLLSVYRELEFGYALWNFKGTYGVVEHNKPGAKYELIDGFQVDRALLEALMDNRV
ncbi:MAG: cellulase family glycosylhydrolase [Clostridiales bacterium]|nr:cellulase family glycosylhydrolase [Clostridiales bacterium]